MITTVCFDVYGADASALQDRATATLRDFAGGSLDEWTVDIEVHEESRVSDGRIATWRGEVTAMRYELRP